MLLRLKLKFHTESAELKSYYYHSINIQCCKSIFLILANGGCSPRLYLKAKQKMFIALKVVFHNKALTQMYVVRDIKSIRSNITFRC